MNRTERFATDPIPVLVRRTCTPLALSMLAQGVDIVDDGLFVAHYGELAYRASTRSAASQGRLVRSWEAVSFAVTGS